MSAVLRLLDRLAGEGAITGYTVEPAPYYLRSRRPALSYAMYARDHVARLNLRRFVGDMAGLGAQLSFHPTIGSTAGPGGLQRTDQLTAVAWFHRSRHLRRAIGLVCRRYAADGAEALPGSWRYPDARICGMAEELPGTIAALAHQMQLPGGAVVVLTRSSQPPLWGMRSQPVRLLQSWAGYLA